MTSLILTTQGYVDEALKLPDTVSVQEYDSDIIHAHQGRRWALRLGIVKDILAYFAAAGHNLYTVSLKCTCTLKHCFHPKKTIQMVSEARLDTM